MTNGAVRPQDEPDMRSIGGRAGSGLAAGAMKRPVALLLGPSPDAMSGVSTHLNMLLASRLAEEYVLVHFQVGSEGRNETGLARLARLVASPLLLGITVLARRVAIVHINTSLNRRAYWRDLAYMIVAKICGAHVLYQVHGGALPQRFFEQSRVLTRFLRRSLRLPDVIVVLAQVELRAYRNFVAGQRIMLIPNGVDCRPYAKLVRISSDARRPLRLLYIGRLAAEKGLYELLQALALARSRGAKARLVIAGSGPEEGQLRHRVRELELVDDVSFVGPAFGERKVKFLAAADALVLASYSEGLPYAVLEAMAAGVPVIATPVGAIPDVVVGDVHGKLVPPRDADAIAEAIAGLASDRDVLARMSLACRRRIVFGYSLARLSEEFCRLYVIMRAGKRIKALTGRDPVIR